MSRRFFLALFCLFAVDQARAWGDLGHSLVGAVAEATMTERARELVRGTIGVEPLSAAAVWADHVRDDVGRFTAEDPASRPDSWRDFSGFHYVEVPTGFDFAGQPPRELKDARGAIRGAIRVLNGKGELGWAATPAQRTIALRFLAHLVGDVHQPLHVGNGFDLGGNACRVKTAGVAGAARELNLHAFWDDDAVEAMAAALPRPAGTNPPRFMSDVLAALKRAEPAGFTDEAKRE